jgi:hypothetical protein
MTLQEFLNEIYGHLGTQRRDLSRGRKEFRIDDQNEKDVPGAFCNMRITLRDPESTEFQLTLYPVPWDKDVEILVEELGGQWQDIPTGRVLEVPMTIKSAPDIRRLARAIRRVTGRGKRYVNPNWKWSTRRTADSLERFAGVLSKWNRSGRKMRPEEIPF